MLRRYALPVVLSILVLLPSVSCRQPVTPSPTPSVPQAPLIVVERRGGIAGFQDRVVIGKNGELYALVNGHEQIGKLDNTKWQQLETWARQFAPFALTLQDNPGGPDNLVRHLTWNGNGSTAAIEAQQREIMDWCQELFASLVTAG